MTTDLATIFSLFMILRNLATFLATILPLPCLWFWGSWQPTWRRYCPCLWFWEAWQLGYNFVLVNEFEKLDNLPGNDVVPVMILRNLTTYLATILSLPMILRNLTTYMATILSLSMILRNLTTNQATMLSLSMDLIEKLDNFPGYNIVLVYEFEKLTWLQCHSFLYFWETYLTILSFLSIFLSNLTTRVSDPDPDPHGSACFWPARIRIRINLRIRIRAKR